MTGHGDPLVSVLILLGFSAVVGYQRFQDWRTPDEGSVEHLHQLYRDGEIDEQELEQRLELVLDPRVEEIRTTVERVSGIGPGKSAAVASKFESLGVGPQLADAIQERV